MKMIFLSIIFLISSFNVLNCCADDGYLPTDLSLIPLYDLHKSIQLQNVSAVKEILERLCVDIDVLYEGFTPLCIAATLTNPKIVRMLLYYGAAVNKPSKFGKTPLEYAKRHNRIDIIKILENQLLEEQNLKDFSNAE